MRIALVNPKFDRSGGAERYALGLAGGLARRGHEVHLYGRRADEVADGVTFHRVPSLPLGRAVKTWSFCRFASLRVAKGAFDVVEGFGKTVCQTVHRAGGGVHGAYLERMGRQTLTAYDRIVLGLENELFSSPHLRSVIAPSRWVAEEVPRFFPNCAPVTVIPNGVDTRLYSPDGREEDQADLRARLRISYESPVLLFAGTNFPLKGLGEAVEALGFVPKAHLVVAGGDDPAPYRDQAAALGVGDRLHFLGARREMAPLYRAADVLVHPSHYDPFPNVCFEAAACGTRVVTTDRTGAEGILGEAGTVLSFPAEARQLARAVLAELARGPDGRAASRELATRFSQERHLAAVEELFYSLVPDRHPA